jgi:hypothetical protein
VPQLHNQLRRRASFLFRAPGLWFLFGFYESPLVRCVRQNIGEHPAPTERAKTFPSFSWACLFVSWNYERITASFLLFPSFFFLPSLFGGLPSSTVLNQHER